jgi:predicted DNA binding CopG/RHH family protein
MYAMRMKRVPNLKTDAEAEDFLEQDLSDLDFRQFKPMRFELTPKDAALNMRIPKDLLDAIKTKAKSRNIPYTRYVRMLLEDDVNRTQR